MAGVTRWQSSTLRTAPGEGVVQRLSGSVSRRGILESRAVKDRLVHRAIKIVIEGKSYRRRNFEQSINALRSATDSATDQLGNGAVPVTRVVSGEADHRRW